MQRLLELEKALSGVMTLTDLEGVMQGLQRVTGSSGVTLFSFEGGARLKLRGPEADRLQVYPEQVFEDDPIRRWNLSLPRTTFLAAGQRFDERGYLSSRAYADFYVPHEIGQMCGVWPTGLPFAQQGMFGFLLWTPSWSRSFAKGGLARLKHIEAPLRAAAGRIQRFRAIEAERELLYTLLEKHNRPIVLWNPEGRLAWVSSAARARLEGTLHGSDLERMAALAGKQLRRLDAASRETLLGRPLRAKSARGRPLFAEFYSVCDEQGRPWLVAELSGYSETLERFAALTKAEAKVLSLLTHGLSNREISERLSVSTETIKTHVQRVLGKLRVSSRSKAAHFVRQHTGKSAATTETEE